MTYFGVRPETEALLRERMQKLGIHETDLSEQFIRGSGAGGQKRNKTSSCVVLRHNPTGIEVRSQRERSQALNRFHARRELCDRIEERLYGIVQREAAAVSKIRRQKARRARKTKHKILRDKAHRKEIKAGRRAPGAE